MGGSDNELLREYARFRREETFASLVARHIDLVFSSAVRQVRSPHLAEEVTQAVFVELARRAAELRSDTVLAAWLYEVARRKAIDVIRAESRRRAREAAAAPELASMNTEPPGWAEIEPRLDDAMAELELHDRQALLLRFFENQSLREVGAALGISEDTAQKRVARALQKLRAILGARGAAATEGALAIELAAHAVQAAPAALARLVATAAAGQSAALVATLFMTSTQKIAVGILLATGFGTAFFGFQRASRLAGEVTALRAARAEAAAEVSPETGALKARVAALERENEQLRRNAAELMKLRGEVTQLAQAERGRKASDDFAAVAVRWKEKELQLRRLIEARPEQRVPEMDLLGDRTLLDIARDADLETERGIRQVFAELRHVAKNVLAPDLSEALRTYLGEHDGVLPARLSGLKPLLKLPVTDAMLEEYELVQSGKFADTPRGAPVILQKKVVDPELDLLWQVRPDGYRNDVPAR